MKKTIQIKGDGSGNITWDVASFLSNVKNGSDYHWKVLWMDSEGNSCKSGYRDLEEKINKDINGREMKWEEIRRMGTEIFQIMDLLLVGDHDKKKITEVNKNNYKDDEFDYTIELIDSGFWEVSSNEDRIKPFLSMTGVVDVTNRGEPSIISKLGKNEYSDLDGTGRRGKAEPLE